MIKKESNPFDKIRDEYDLRRDKDKSWDAEENKDCVFEWLEDVIPRIQLTGEYKGFLDENKNETDTPFDKFDSECHKQGTGIATKDSKELIDEEEELIMLINLSEHINKPKDMLMFLGEYFKQTVTETYRIWNNNEENK